MSELPPPTPSVAAEPSAHERKRYVIGAVIQVAALVAMLVHAALPWVLGSSDAYRRYAFFMSLGVPIAIASFGAGMWLGGSWYVRRGERIGQHRRVGALFFFMGAVTALGGMLRYRS